MTSSKDSLVAIYFLVFYDIRVPTYVDVLDRKSVEDVAGLTWDGQRSTAQVELLNE